MNRLSIIQWLFLFASIILLVATGYGQSGRPNIIIIVADDLGWNDVGYHNSKIISPNLDALAKRGVELTRFYVAPICSPTRAGLLTGKYPDRFGIRNEVIKPNMIGGLPLEEKTLANVLAEAGYERRGAFGKWHLGHSDARYHPLNRGFTYYYGHYNGAIDYYTHYRNGALDWHRNFEVSKDTGYSVELVANEAIKFINESTSSKPFFAYIAFNGVHSPVQARQQDLIKNGFDPEKPSEKIPSGGGQPGEYNGADFGKRGKGNNLRQTFSAMVTGVDDAIGRIWSALEAKGITQNTIIWFLSDNGGIPTFGGNNEPLRGTKHTEWEGGVRSTSLVYWKGKFEGGIKTGEVMGFVDVLPTISSIVHLKTLPSVDGKNVADGIRGKKLPERIFFLGKEAVVSGQWKLNEGQLFDLSADPSETTNVAAAHPAEFNRLNKALTEFKKIVIPTPFPSQPQGWRPPENWAIPASPVTKSL